MSMHNLERAIKQTNSKVLKDIAFEYLKLRGMSEPTITDGRYDGGGDIVTSWMPSGENEVAVQVTVSNDWSSKIVKDAKKVKEDLGLEYLIFVCSRRIPQSKFVDKRQDIISKYGVFTEKVDNQTIASKFKEEGEVSKINDLLGLTANPVQTEESTHTNIKQRASASFALFGEKPNSFRDEVIESSIISVIIESDNNLERDEIIDRVKSLARLEQAEEIASGAIDRMLQDKVLKKESGKDIYFVSEDAKEEYRQEVESYKKEMENLRIGIKKYLEQYELDRLSEEAIDSITSSVGAMMMDAAESTASSMADGAVIDQISQVEERLRGVHSTLDSIGLPQGEERDSAIEDICTIASASPAGKRIFAGELFYLLTSIDTPQLVTALGGGKEFELILDTSVALPLLCGRLYESSDHRFGFATSSLFKQVSSKGVPLVVPDVYLEEMASHLVEAKRDYTPVVSGNIDKDLIESENAYVSHFTSLRLSGDVGPFSDYIEGFGYRDHIKKEDFNTAVNMLMSEIKSKLLQYNIEVRDVKKDDKEFLNVKSKVQQVLDSNNMSRPDILISHDSHTIKHLKNNALSSDKVQVLCTWDSIPRKYEDLFGAHWDSMSPEVVNDVLNLADKRDDYGKISSPTSIAKSIHSRSSQKGSKIWDTIVSIESGNMYDADLLRKAEEFKEHFIKVSEDRISRQDIREAWKDWKNE